MKRRREGEGGPKTSTCAGGLVEKGYSPWGSGRIQVDQKGKTAPSIEDRQKRIERSLKTEKRQRAQET